MKKRITIIAAALALLTLTAVSNAATPTASGVLVRTDDGYIITATLRDPVDSHVVGTAHGTLIERTTGFNTCPFIGVASAACIFPWACNLLDGEITFNFQGEKFNGQVSVSIAGRSESSLCQDPVTPTTYQLDVNVWSQTHTIPGEFPDVFELLGTVQQVTPALFKWSGGWGCSGPGAEPCAI